tara:strand:+ start:4380 stop:4748 length:369 start_codon:yes stop_codon:yes gene_type:complete
MSLSYDELISNIKRQAKRLSKSINIPLRQAQKILATSVYQCDDWNNLRDSLKSDSFDNQLLLLTALHPKADILLFKLLDNNMSIIVSRFKMKFSDQKSNEEISNIIISTFGIEPFDFKNKIL